MKKLTITAIAAILLATSAPAYAGPSNWFSSSIQRMKADWSCRCDSRAPQNQYTRIRVNGKYVTVRVTDPRAPSSYWNNYDGDNRGARTQAQQQKWDGD